MSKNKQEVIGHIKKVLVELFELDEAEIVEDAQLYEDLDIDSIDTIDLLIELKKYVDKEIDAEAFVDSRTIGDIADVIVKL